MIIDCHGHYTTAPKALEAWRNRQIAGIQDPALMRRLAEIERNLRRTLSEPESAPTTVTRRAPRQVRMFTTPTQVAFSEDSRNQRTILEIAAGDRPGLLSEIGKVLLAERVDVVTARIMTIGERAEDATGLIPVLRLDPEPRAGEQRGLGRAEVRAVQGLVEVDDDDERHPREMVTLGQHLGSHQQTGLAGFDLSGGGEPPDPIAQRWSGEPIWWEPEQVAARLHARGEDPADAARREVAEETGCDARAIEAFFDLDQVNQFHEPSVDAIVTAAVFAARVRAEMHLLVAPFRGEGYAMKIIDAMALGLPVMMPALPGRPKI